MRLVYRYMVILCLFFIVPDTLELTEKMCWSV